MSESAACLRSPQVPGEPTRRLGLKHVPWHLTSAGATDVTIVGRLSACRTRVAASLTYLSLLASAEGSSGRDLGDARDQGRHRPIPAAAPVDAQGTFRTAQRQSGSSSTCSGTETIHDRSHSGLTAAGRSSAGKGLDIFQKGSGSQFDISARRQGFQAGRRVRDHHPIATPRRRHCQRITCQRYCSTGRCSAT